MFTGALSRKTDLTKAESETWRPPVFSPPAQSALGKLLAKARRFFDLQAGSIWRDLSAVLPSVRGAVLDVGCGAQPYRPLLHASAKYCGIDTSAAREKFGYEVPETRYFDGEIWPVEDGSIQFLLVTETLEHVLDTSQFLSEAARCMAPGGTILITVPFAARWHFVPFDYWRFTPSSLDYLLRVAGFTDIHVYARGNAATVACYKTMALILPLLMPQNLQFVLAWCARLLGLTLLPVLVVLAIIANLTLCGRGGNDCLGYTVLGQRGTDESSKNVSRML